VTLLETASDLALRYLNESAFKRLRERYFALRMQIRPVLRAVHGTFSASALGAHLQARIGGSFEILMVHSSFNRLKPMYDDGPLELQQMLMRWCGSDKTLVMPAFFFGDPQVGGTSDTFERNPRFDVRRTPSQMGVLTELFRRTRGVRCSRHPIYRVCALGPLAAELTATHESADWPCGVHSPFDVMTRHDTVILGIGKPIEVLTHVHHVEDVLGERFPVPRSHGTDLQMTLVDGDLEIPFTLRRQGCLWPRDMWKLREIMPADVLQEWRFHSVPMFATRARDVTERLSAAAARGKTIYKKP
jgi:aminoglycoside 3-N-acetyltransferase